MNYEKVYKEAIKRAKEEKEAFIDLGNFSGKSAIERIFPELRESEDEKIRKALLESFKYQQRESYTDKEWLNGIKLSEIVSWLEKQGEPKEYTFKSIPRLLYMIEPTERAKAYCQKLIDTFVKEGYSADAKIVEDCLKQMNGEVVAMAVMDEKQGEQKPSDKVEPKFKPGDNIIEKDLNECGSGTIKEIKNNKYYFTNGTCIDIQEQDLWQLVKEHIEPKFKVGDWIVNKLGHVWHINSFDKKNYQVSNGDKYNYFPISKQDEMRLWTIQDAEDGDVLAEHETIVLFKKIEGQNIRCYCTYHYLGLNPTFYVGTLQNKNPYCPATKEQRDLLFQKMKEAGYKWDAEKKELKKIPNALEECEIEHIEHGKYYYCIKDYYTGGYKKASKGEVVQALRGMSMMGLGVKANEYFIPVKCIVDVRPAWSEEDERNLQGIIDEIEANKSDATDYDLATYDSFLSWLKSIKDRVQPQPKQEWSEEDLKQAAKYLREYATHVQGGNSKRYVLDLADRIEYLEPNHWKPSEEQMEALNAINNIGELSYVEQSDLLVKLYNDLKKL